MADIAGWLPVAMQAIGALTSFVGNSQSAAAARVAAQRAQVAAQFEASQLEQNAGQAIAVSQAQAKEQLRQTRLLQSRAIAVTAAGGGGVSDDTIMRLLSRNAGEGAYRAQLALYNGEEKARQLRMAASTKLYEAQLNADSQDAKANAYETAAMGGLVSSAGSIYAKNSSLFSKYGNGGPGAVQTSVNYNNDAGIASTIDMGLV